MYPSNQTNIEKINYEINNLERMRNQLMTPQPAVTQNFQLNSNNNQLRIVNSIDDVNKTIVFGATPFINQDYTLMWIKGVDNSIRTFNISEIIPKDEKDLMIEKLQKRIEELEGGLNEQCNENDGKSLSTAESSTKTTSRTSNAVGKSTKTK